MRENSYVEAIFAGKFQPGEPVLELHLASMLCARVMRSNGWSGVDGPAKSNK